MSLLSAETMRSPDDVESSVVIAPLPDTPTPGPTILPSFSHIPPVTIRGRHRWPYLLDAQSFPSTTCPCLHDILIHIDRYLEATDRATISCTSSLYQLGPRYGPLWFSRPWSPNRRRRWGFGIPDRDRTVVTDALLPHGFIHFV
jgi:hypothetical protein